MASDRPFIYVFDGANLADGPYTNSLVVPIETDSNFHLRRMVGAGSITNIATGGRFVLYDMDGRAITSEVGYTPPSYAAERMMSPESIYTGPSRESAIRMRVTDILRANRPYPVGGSTPNYTSDVYFQGVKRFNDTPPYRTPYEWKPKAWDVPFVVDLWAGRQAPAYTVAEPARRFTFNVDYFDWDLWGVSMAINRATDPADTWVEPYQNVKLSIFDAQKNAFMSGPVMDYAINLQSTYAASVFPVPPIAYPANSALRFELTSLLINTELPARLNLTFHGHQRVHC